MPKTALLKIYRLLKCASKKNVGKCSVKKSKLGFFSAGLFRAFNGLLRIVNYQKVGRVCTER